MDGLVESLQELKFQGLDDQGTRQKFSIASFNTLAEYLSPIQSFCDSQFLNFEYRKSRLSQIIRNFNTDFICLQEIDHYNDFFQQCLDEIGYESYYVKRPSPNHPDGSLIAWKKETWTKIEAIDIDFNNCFLESVDESLYKRNNIGILIAFRNSFTQELIIVGTVHFFWDPQFEYVKFLQGKILVEWTFKLKEKYNARIVITGDFNSLENTFVTDYLIGKQLIFDENVMNQKMMKEIYEPLPLVFKNAFENYCEKGYPDFSNYTLKFKGLIDHVFYSEGLQVTNLGKLPQRSDFFDIIGIPNSNFPSDHLPLICYFCFN